MPKTSCQRSSSTTSAVGCSSSPSTTMPVDSGFTVPVSPTLSILTVAPLLSRRRAAAVVRTAGAGAGSGSHQTHDQTMECRATAGLEPEPGPELELGRCKARRCTAVQRTSPACQAGRATQCGRRPGRGVECQAPIRSMSPDSGCRNARGYRRVILDDHLRTLGAPAGGWPGPAVTPQARDLTIRWVPDNV